MIDKLVSTLRWLTNPVVTLSESEDRQASLLAKILLFVLLFSIAILLTMLIFNPHHDPYYKQYSILISGLVAFLALAYGLSLTGYYKIAAAVLVTCAALMPWISLIIDPSIFQGDFVPLTYLIFSILLSSILLPIQITTILATLQIAGITLVLLFSPAAPSFNWFSFLAFFVLTSVFSILANSIIHRNMKQIDSQAHQLSLNEARLREQSIRDYLTGLYNRRYLEETLKREIQRAERAHQPLCIIMLDIDNFKSINDTLGHAAGDIVLQEVGNFLSGQVRQSDIACRYGGDEIVLIFPDTSREVIIKRAEHLRNEIKSFQIEYKKKKLAPVTISLGVAVYPDDANNDEKLLISADIALFQAKRGGGNQVVMAD